MLNKVQIIGHLGRDPETRYTQGGEAATTFSVACSERWKDKSTGEAKEHTEWVSVSTFGKLAEICGEYLKCGSLVYIEGKLQTRKYTDKQGVERYATSVKADVMRMLGGKSDQADRPAPAPAPAAQRRAPAPASAIDDLDEIPF